MATPTCPKCTTPLEQAGYTERCASCDGAWIREDALVGMLQERAATLVFLPWQPRAVDIARACPSCGEPMVTANLGAVALDRCAAHGVWFDHGELAELLRQARQFKAPDHDAEPHEHHRLRDAIAKLFG